MGLRYWTDPYSIDLRGDCGSVRPFYNKTAAQNPRALGVHVANSRVLGNLVRVIQIQLLGKYMTLFSKP